MNFLDSSLDCWKPCQGMAGAGGMEFSGTLPRCTARDVCVHDGESGLWHALPSPQHLPTYLGHEHDLADERQVGDGHGHGAEERLRTAVSRQGLSLAAGPHQPASPAPKLNSKPQPPSTRSPRHLERLGQLRAPRVAWVHGDEGHHAGLERNLSVLKHKSLLARAQRVQHALRVLGGGRHMGELGGAAKERRACHPATIAP